QSVTQNVTVTGGATSVANVALAPVASTGSVTGKVTNISNGAAIAGATVSWSGGSTTTTTAGIYTLSNIPAGSHNFTAVKTGYLARSTTITVTGGTTSTLNFQISVAGKITAKVVSPSGAVVSGATITIKGGGIATTVTGNTSTTGLFTTNWIPVGTYTVTVSKSGHTTKTKTGIVSSGLTTTITFTGF
ncbi:MAG TPA: carboxypeptidase-like regulatory domain-containing protein, partial [Candidatus Angelobacter sp.]|nr:carboxypeptidase-like regulatory domain-containing protein [Candidatus Angelobacter sp.]